ncbi:MAG: prolyl oligopeptidase family serine peptidase [Egibacteraceae bacterium]
MPSYPPARRLSLTVQIAGRWVPDAYRWLEDPSHDDTHAWSAAQDSLFHAHRDTWRSRPFFRQRLRELLSVGSVAVPVWRGKRTFRMREVAGKDHLILFVVKPDGQERMLVDPDQIDPTGETMLVAWRPSWDGRLLAYQLARRGSEESALWVVEVGGGRVLDGPISPTRRSPVAWTTGGDFYYVRQPSPAGDLDEGGVMLHRVGNDPADDIRVFGEGYERGTRFGVGASADGRWLFLSVAPGAVPRNHLFLADLTKCDPCKPDLRIVHEGTAQASLKFGGQGQVLVLTDREAPNGQICALDPSEPSEESWSQLVPEEPDAVLDDCVILGGEDLSTPMMLVARTRHAVSELLLHDPVSGARIGEVPLPGLGSVRNLRQRDGHEAWFTYTDFTSPPALYRFDAREGRLERLEGARRARPDVHTRQVTYPAKDGTALRMFLISAEAKPSRPRPTILFVYGGFGASCLPVYSPTALAWVQAGGVYAVASVRGGGEEGAAWHRAGRGENKQNTFDDVHASAEWLVRRSWTTREQLVLSGGSHGGLVVGAMLTQHPDACAAVVCSNPVLDMVRYEHFGMGHMWVEEFGSTADPEQLDWLLSYSPYHRVQPGVEYPATLFTCPDVDPRVDTLHVRKMAAALQHATASQRPVLVRREIGVGHTSGSAASMLELWSDVLGFAAHSTGLIPEA